MAITRIDPTAFESASTVQVDSDAGNAWLAIDEVEAWAAANGFVRTSEYHPRQVLVNGKRRFRAICFRISDDERAAMELNQAQMIERGQRLQALAPQRAGPQQ